MANSHLISQLAKLIENNYKQKTIIAHQLSVLAAQELELEKQIQSNPLKRH